MGTPNSTIDNLNFRVAQIVVFGRPDEKKLVLQCEKLIAILVEKVKPILRYISKNHPHQYYSKEKSQIMNIRGIGLGYDCENHCTLFLTDAGTFISVEDDNYHYTDRQECWKNFILFEVVGAFQKALADAEATREKHLTSLKTRSSFIANMIAFAEKADMSE